MAAAVQSGADETRVVDTGENAALLGCVADPIRLGLIDRLATAGKSCVCNMQTEPPIPANLLSYHLKVLRDADLVIATRRGRWMDYELAPDALQRLHAAIPTAATAGSGCGDGADEAVAADEADGVRSVR